MLNIEAAAHFQTLQAQPIVLYLIQVNNGGNTGTVWFRGGKLDAIEVVEITYKKTAWDDDRECRSRVVYGLLVAANIRNHCTSETVKGC